MQPIFIFLNMMCTAKFRFYKNFLFSHELFAVGGFRYKCVVNRRKNSETISNRYPYFCGFSQTTLQFWLSAARQTDVLSGWDCAVCMCSELNFTRENKIDIDLISAQNKVSCCRRRFGDKKILGVFTLICWHWPPGRAEGENFRIDCADCPAGIS